MGFKAQLTALLKPYYEFESVVSAANVLEDSNLATDETLAVFRSTLPVLRPGEESTTKRRPISLDLKVAAAEGAVLLDAIWPHVCDIRTRKFGDPKPPLAGAHGVREHAADIHLFTDYTNQLSALTGFDKLDLLDFILTGQQPVLKAVELLEEERSFSGPVAQRGTLRNRYLVLRLNRCPNYKEMRQIHGAIRKQWPSTGRAKPELEVLRAAVVQVFGSEKEASNPGKRWCKKKWKAVADHLAERGLTTEAKEPWRSWANKWDYYVRRATPGSPPLQL